MSGRCDVVYLSLVCMRHTLKRCLERREMAERWFAPTVTHSVSQLHADRAYSTCSRSSGTRRSDEGTA